MTGKRPTGSKNAFASFGLGKNILRAVTEAGFNEPRPIQAKTIPQVLKGRDVLGLAQTGTGKTAAFALPIIERLVASRGQNPRALVIAPTRELAMQIHSDFQMLGKFTNIRSTTVFGGVSAVPQKRALRSRPDVIVACPGRLLDLMGSKDVRLDGLEVLVLDEADHMLDMGFLPDIKRIIKQLPERRQNLLFSATMPREIRSLTDNLLHNPHVVELAITAPMETIEHALYPVEQSRKTDLLTHLLHEQNFTSAIVFLRTKHRTRRLARDLERAGMNAIALQGNMSQGQRQRAMQGFREGRYNVLVATDIAARGIDVAGISHVINYDIPNTPDAYTHRIGRTGRAEQSGKACTFVTGEDFAGVQAIERKLNMQIPRIKLKGFSGGVSERATGRSQGRRQGGGGNKKPSGRRNFAGAGSSHRPAQAKSTTSQSQAPQESFGAGVGGATSGRSGKPKHKLSKAGKRRQRMRSGAGAGSRRGRSGGRGR
ncbi:MAG: RNA helicase [Planctomycetes bacterium]|nr:RNA helicase [Planctomycetota bacterium]HJM57177.1 DEAD/DEAH box helicase [Planctomycetota bacterium]